MIKNLKIFSYIVLLFIIMTSSIYSVNQEIILNYEFEENGGNVILDTSENQNHIFNGGATWTGDEQNGIYALNFDGSNDYVEGIISVNELNSWSVSFWVNLYWFGTQTIIYVDDSNNNRLIELNINTNAGNNLIFQYTNNLNNPITLNIDTNNFNLNQYYFITLNYDDDNNNLSYYRNNVKINDFSNVDINSFSENILFKLGNDKGTSYLNGNLDSLNLFNFELNLTQISSLYNDNSISLSVDEIIENMTSETSDIIISSFPNNETLSNLVQFDLILNSLASCDFYLENNLIYTFEDIVSISFTETLEEGNYNYFYYCSYLQNETLSYEISQIFNFIVETPITEIVFQVEGNDFNINDEELYITSPCPVKGFSAVGYEAGYQSKYNKEGILWSKLKNGITTLNLSAENHEFCLFNGRVIINELEQTTNYNVQTKEGLLHLGNFSIPNNNYQIYKLNVDKFEIYDVYNPKAHNSTWSEFLGALFLFLIGGGITFIGVKAESKVMILIGGTLLLGAFGLSLGGVIALIQL